ncbi:MAG: DUF2807 domain-containing protein [Bacteroides sp.]|nr:DUF2807 domain-containing protein [Bacteroides sp.]MCM1412878.1 DUF2807 domain-containing protein [Bacteroides sp.]MCM1471547.1 DUF2807 domain-containing protein [Bacteroides sp.]
MKTKILTIMFMWLTAIAVQAADGHYHMQLKDFDELRVIDGVNVVYQCNADKAGLVEFDSPAEMASAVMFESNNGRLTISLAQTDKPLTALPTIHVYSSHLSKVSNDGDSLVTLSSLPVSPSLNIRVIGNGSIEARGLNVGQLKASIVSGHGNIIVTGRADNASYSITGTGIIEAMRLTAQEASCRSTGTGTITVYAIKTLSLGGLGGTIRYYGDPQIKKKFLTSLKIEHID